MEQLIYEVNGKRYLLMDEVITEKNEDQYQRKCKYYGAIITVCKEMNIRTAWWHSPFTYGIVGTLVPEEKAFDFNNDSMKNF